MMAEKPTDEQKLILHICREAEKRGRASAWISRDDMLNGKTVPAGVGMKLVWAALTMPKGILEWSPDEQHFRLSNAASAAAT